MFIIHCSLSYLACVQIRHNPLSGGYCGEVPPLPIPNREVKLTCADGTAMQCGRVGSRLLLSKASDFERFLRLFRFPADFSFSHWFFFCFTFLSFSHRFHRCTQIFLLLYLFPTDFTDAHRFFFFVDEKDFVRNLFCFSLV